MRVGITGHSNLSAGSVPVVADAIRAELATLDGPITGVSCLARGADQVFAQVIVETGAALHVVLPAADYRERKVKPANRAAFESLVERAENVDVLAFETSNREAYEAANKTILSTVDVLFAVWDGQPPDGRGGTGDTVRLARESGVPVMVLWPDGVARDETS